MTIFRSFKHAIKGLKEVIRRERNARVHLVAAILVLIISWFLHISSTQFVLVVLAIGLVFFAEVVNSAIEKTLDLVSDGNNQIVKIVKDMCAAAVLVTALTASAIAVIVFLPYIIKLFHK